MEAVNVLGCRHYKCLMNIHTHYTSLNERELCGFDSADLITTPENPIRYSEFVNLELGGRGTMRLLFRRCRLEVRGA
jgi:hypothetical protein